MKLVKIAVLIHLHLCAAICFGQFGPSTNSLFPVATSAEPASFLLINHGGSANRNLPATNALSFLNAVADVPLATASSLSSGLATKQNSLGYSPLTALQTTQAVLVVARSAGMITNNFSDAMTFGSIINFPQGAIFPDGSFSFGSGKVAANPLGGLQAVSFLGPLIGNATTATTASWVTAGLSNWISSQVSGGGISVGDAATMMATNVAQGRALGATNLYGSITRSQVTGLETSLAFLSNAPAATVSLSISNQWQADAATAAQRATNASIIRGIIVSGGITNNGVVAITHSAPTVSISTNNAATLTNLPVASLNWSGISTAAFTNGVAARIPAYTNGGITYYIILSTNAP